MHCETGCGGLASVHAAVVRGHDGAKQDLLSTSEDHQAKAAETLVQFGEAKSEAERQRLARARRLHEAFHLWRGSCGTGEVAAQADRSGKPPTPKPTPTFRIS